MFNISESQKREYSEIIAIFEHQQYSFLSSEWSASNYVSSQNASLSVTEVFDPTLTMEDGVTLFWILDLSFSHIDSDGWVYGGSYDEIDKGRGKESMQGFRFTLVRRRVWKRNNDPKLSK